MLKTVSFKSFFNHEVKGAIHNLRGGKNSKLFRKGESRRKDLRGKKS